MGKDMMLKVHRLKQRFFDFYSINELYLRCGGFRDIGYSRYPVFVTHRAEEAIRAAYEEIVDDFYNDIYEALVASIKSELHHYPSSTYNSAEFKLEKMGIPPSVWREVKKNPRSNPEVAYALFKIPSWISAYGGVKWAKGAKWLIAAKKVKTRADKVYWIDRVLDLYHNGGHMINKTQYRVLSKATIRKKTKSGYSDWYNCLEFRAKARSIFEFLPYNSCRVRRLVIPQKKILTASSECDSM